MNETFEEVMKRKQVNVDEINNLIKDSDWVIDDYNEQDDCVYITIFKKLD
jgi:hypothetical protein